MDRFNKAMNLKRPTKNLKKSDSNRKKILVADDYQISLEYLGLFLKRLGYTSIYAKNGLDVLKLLKLEKPDAVILDIGMEMMDGITVLKAIKEDKQLSDIPVIMVSGDKSTETIEKCRRLGCVGYLTKPVTADKLHDVLEECLFSGRKH